METYETELCLSISENVPSVVYNNGNTLKTFWTVKPSCLWLQQFNTLFLRHCCNSWKRSEMLPLLDANCLASELLNLNHHQLMKQFSRLIK